MQYNFTYVQSFLNTLSEIDIAQTHGHSKIAVVGARRGRVATVFLKNRQAPEKALNKSNKI